MRVERSGTEEYDMSLNVFEIVNQGNHTWTYQMASRFLCFPGFTTLPRIYHIASDFLPFLRFPGFTDCRSISLLTLVIHYELMLNNVTISLMVFILKQN